MAAQQRGDQGKQPAAPVTAPHCADCGFPREQKACVAPAGKNPPFCPMLTHPQVIAESQQAYQDPTTRAFSKQAALQESAGYADRQARPWVRKPCKTRIEEIWEFAARMGYQKLGLAFCMGFVAEARVVARMLASHQLQVVSVVCKVGAVPKELIGLADEDKIRGGGGHESMCNPVAQARLLNNSGTELNVLLGLCVGHDALFIQHAEAPCTVLAVKDRVTGHNPLAAIYTLGSYYDRLK